MLWLLEVQCLLADITGARLSPQDFGAPAASRLLVSSGQIGIGSAPTSERPGVWSDSSTPTRGGQPASPQEQRQQWQPAAQYGGQYGTPAMGSPAMAHERGPVGSPAYDPSRITPRNTPPAHASLYAAPPGTPGSCRPDQVGT